MPLNFPYRIFLVEVETIFVAEYLAAFWQSRYGKSGQKSITPFVEFSQAVTA